MCCRCLANWLQLPYLLQILFYIPCHNYNLPLNPKFQKKLTVQLARPLVLIKSIWDWSNGFSSFSSNKFHVSSPCTFLMTIPMKSKIEIFRNFPIFTRIWDAIQFAMKVNKVYGIVTKSFRVTCCSFYSPALKSCDDGLNEFFIEQSGGRLVFKVLIIFSTLILIRISPN